MRRRSPAFPKAGTTKPGPSGDAGSGGGGSRSPAAAAGTAALVLGALGVVYGDIGTSPLYAVQTVFSIDGGRIGPTTGDVLGVISMVVWSLTIIVSVKYVTVVLRADNNGEGGVLALSALVRRALGTRARAAGAIAVVGLVGASLFYGDSVITPAISVLSAVQGLELPDPGLASLVVPLSAVILAALFVVQARGTQRIGSLFGPVMVCWFVVIGVAGARGISLHPGVLVALSPTYAFAFIGGHPDLAFVSVGAVVLAVTGAEALYADVGHFGKAPIRLAWFALVFPALTLNYLGQAGLLLRDQADKSNPFFLLMPPWARLPSVVLATAATIIASQAVISGTYSMTKQAIQLGFLPPMEVRHTSRRQAGQIYMPGVNWALFVGVLVLVLTFRSSARLAGAYGIAVTGTFLTTTCMLVVLARVKWHWPHLAARLDDGRLRRSRIGVLRRQYSEGRRRRMGAARDRRRRVHGHDHLAPRTSTGGGPPGRGGRLAGRLARRPRPARCAPSAGHGGLPPPFGRNRPAGPAGQCRAEQHPARARRHRLRRGQPTGPCGPRRPASGHRHRSHRRRPRAPGPALRLFRPARYPHRLSARRQS